MRFVKLSLALFTLIFLLAVQPLPAETWSIPLGGNAYRTEPSPGGHGIGRSANLLWSSDAEVYSVFFHIDRPAVLELQLKAHVPQGQSTLRTTLGKTTHGKTTLGKQSLETRLQGTAPGLHQIGEFEIDRPGYVRVDLRGVSRQGNVFADISDLIVSSGTESLTLDYVKTSAGGMFYWGRRGPSVHLRYQVPNKVDLKYAYSEITVPEGQDPIGSYFMANGFGEGYFGIQVNSPTERRILFSVWSPFKTDNPRDIPQEQRIANLGNGPGVHVGKFGNEGSGGQSYLVYPWKSGTTYRFLTEVNPDGKGNTIYTSWFSEKKADKWRLIASFRRPKTNTHLRGFHSFLESFSPNLGYIGRGAFYGNTWVRDAAGKWHECTRARFSVDATGGGRHRLDFNGGAEGDSFFMRNCGFFDETGKPGSWFERQSTQSQQPKIDFNALPRG